MYLHHYTPHDTNEMRLADKPNALTDKEWKDLVKFWTTEKHQDQTPYQNNSTKYILDFSLTCRTMLVSRSH
ncbi:hypothetical protein MKX01_007592 [Papaver californicum]|nr:hypothetical protein MKX01_007592 [Papaver californicum]